MRILSTRTHVVENAPHKTFKSLTLSPKLCKYLVGHISPLAAAVLHADTRATRRARERRKSNRTETIGPALVPYTALMDLRIQPEKSAR